VDSYAIEMFVLEEFFLGDRMPRVSINQIAPDFSLPDFMGKGFKLSDLRGKKNVLLVFNRTFT
jgi:hypothetical protein